MAQLSKDGLAFLQQAKTLGCSPASAPANAPANALQIPMQIPLQMPCTHICLASATLLCFARLWRKLHFKIPAYTIKPNDGAAAHVFDQASDEP